MPYEYIDLEFLGVKSGEFCGRKLIASTHKYISPNLRPALVDLPMKKGRRVRMRRQMETNEIWRGFFPSFSSLPSPFFHSANDGAKWIENFPFSFKLSLSMDAAQEESGSRTTWIERARAQVLSAKIGREKREPSQG